MYLIFNFITLIVLCACVQSYDLSDEEFDNVSISEEELENPTWEGSIKFIVEKKCSICHTETRNSFIPANTPASLDDIHLENQFELFATSINYRVFDDEEDPMPPIFSTPLTSDEKTALYLYIENL